MISKKIVSLYLNKVQGGKKEVLIAAISLLIIITFALYSTDLSKVAFSTSGPYRYKYEDKHFYTELCGYIIWVIGIMFVVVKYGDKTKFLEKLLFFLVPSVMCSNVLMVLSSLILIPVCILLNINTTFNIFIFEFIRIGSALFLINNQIRMSYQTQKTLIQ